MMQKLLITTASTIALMFGAATMAAAQDRSAPAPQDPAATPSSPTSPGAGAIKRDGAMEKDPAMQQRRSTGGTGGTGGASADGATFRSYSDNKASLGGVTIAGGLSADKLIGGDVLNATGDGIGEVEDLIVDANNKVTKAVIEVGGFLGMGSKYVAVDIAQLKQGAKEEGLVTAMTKEELKTLPEYKKESGAWVRTYQQ